MSEKGRKGHIDPKNFEIYKQAKANKESKGNLSTLFPIFRGFI